MSLVFIDIEVNQNNTVVDIGAFENSRRTFHGDRAGLVKFLKGYDYICGHNIFRHDLKYLENEVKQAKIKKIIDTLPLSALLFAEHPYHSLLKDYKINKNEKNDPYVDASITQTLFFSLVERFYNLTYELKNIYYKLLSKRDTFFAFFEYIKFKPDTESVEKQIRSFLSGQFCSNVDLHSIIGNYPEELAYCIAIINTSKPSSITPEWIIHQYGDFLPVMHSLRGTPCHICYYCQMHFDAKLALKKYFNFDDYRTFDGKNLQEQCVIDQISGKSIIGVFPTAGGKSIAFQVPALIMGDSVKGLTVVISPLQSLMQDQVSNLSKQHIHNVGTINGAMNAFERKQTIDHAREGDINLLYLAPETLRSPSIFRLLKRRNIVRFVIDEAHCLSTWGHDFRVDYLYIATFIKHIQNETMNNKKIPISCFTATAKKEVIDDILEYFKKNLDLTMDVIQADTRRKNLHFFVHSCKGHHEKMAFIRSLLDGSSDKPVIIYTSRRKAAEEVASELNQSGFVATFYHGGMKAEIKNSHQLDFTRGNRNIIVATSAFGMGVDKKDVAYVVHYQVSSTIEDYIQEAGRGGRDPQIHAECHILYDERDIDEHFNLLTQSKLSHSEINQVWRTIKFEAKKREKISISTRELAKKSGFDVDNDNEYDTKIKTIILALENVNYIERLENSARIFATSIVQKSMIEVSKKIERIPGIDDKQKFTLSSIMSSLFTKKSTSPTIGIKPISMIDELYDVLGLEKKVLLDSITLLKDNKILEFENDLFAQIPLNYDLKKSQSVVAKQIKIMHILLDLLSESARTNYNIKELNEFVKSQMERSDVKSIDVALRFLNHLKLVEQRTDGQYMYHRTLTLIKEKTEALHIIDHLADITDFIIQYSYMLFDSEKAIENKTINYSIVGLKDQYVQSSSLLKRESSLVDIENAILLIIRCGALIVDGGFLVVYNPMTILLKEKNVQKQYTQVDYKTFYDYYLQKIAKIHILVHFVQSLSEGEEKGLSLVSDYFTLPYVEFEKKYITKEYRALLDKPISKKKYDNLIKDLSQKQLEIINDKTDKNIAVLAGPGSGKTTLLVHKLASLVQLEDVKTNELLMLTFSRAATVVFKEKLQKLIGNRANYISIKTFHSFCFDIIGELGNLEKTESLFTDAIAKIEDKEADEFIINKTTVVIDEAQDMSEDEYRLIEALLKYNGKMRVIAVGDDDQNIYEFRGSNSKYLMKLAENECTTYELLTNFRSKRNLVNFSQKFAKNIKQRYKQNDCISNFTSDGNIRIYNHVSKDFYLAIVDQVKKMNHYDSIGILTWENEEAEIMTSILQKEGIPARLIQNNNGFRLTNLYEVDYFLSLFDAFDGFITNEMWKKNIENIINKFNNSVVLENVLELIDGYQILNPEKKYLVDLKSYFYEAKLEDFFKIKKGSVTVSNIHKSKGREFDTVYIMHQKSSYRQEDLRALYVAITRAKSNLIIHTTNDLFDSCVDDSIKTYRDDIIYTKPEELVIQLEYSDINLGGCKYCSRTVNDVFGGTILTVDEKGCLLNGKYVLYFSKKAKGIISNKFENGYHPVSGVVQYKVKWYSEEEKTEYWIVLPRISFKFEDIERVIEPLEITTSDISNDLME